MHFRPFHDRVVVKRIEAEEKSACDLEAAAAKLIDRLGAGSSFILCMHGDLCRQSRRIDSRQARCIAGDPVPSNGFLV
jgi:hypothetical protein